MDIIIILILLGLVVYFWYDSLKNREIAEQAARRVCHNVGVQFLDHSVGIKMIKPARSNAGRLTLKRIYSFDFSTNGSNRLEGRALMLGSKLLNIQIDHEEGTTIEQEN